MRKAFAGILFVVALALSTGFVVQAQTPKKSKIPATLEKEARISPEQARTAALKRVPGQIEEEELEKEHGKLVYSYDIRATGQKDITEVQVDARDGAILSVEKENAAHEAKEQLRDPEKQ